ncbi:MAG: hypothetical protein KAW17_02645 [Candidatus Eisenbacteria sp.]|nr:hypothetical protein [Candidatus Eisenbacteria bacterium]
MRSLPPALLPGCIAFVAAITLTHIPALARPAGWSREIRLGYDRLSHDYRLIDQDTTNTFSEGNVRLRVAYRPSSLSGGEPEGKAAFFLGKDYWQADLEVEQGFSTRASWSWRGEVSGRQYLSSSDLSFSNDHIQGEARVRYRRALIPSMEIQISDRVHAIAYSERTGYLYDSYLNDARLSCRIGEILSNSLDLDLTHKNLAVPDSSFIGYTSNEFTVQYFGMSSLTMMVTARSTVDWRRYPSGSPRSNFFRTDSDFYVDRAMTDRIGVEAVAQLRAEWYETVDPIYLNSQTYAFQIGPSVQISDRWELKLLPGVEIYNISDFEDPSATPAEDWIYIQESYREYIIEIASDYMWLPGFWGDLSARIGHRNYEFSDGVLDSDYWYLDLSFLADIQLWDGVHVNFAGLFSPEKHRDPEDNTAMNVLSAWIGYRF